MAYKAAPEEDSDRIGLNLLRALGQCPICLEIPPAMIMSCSQGHNVCHSCFEKGVIQACNTKTLHLCPMCRVAYDVPTTRNLSLEQLIQRSGHLLPCSNAGLGCTATNAGHFLPEHDKECRYQPISCPILIRNAQGFHLVCPPLPMYSRTEIAAHITAVHSNSLATDPEQSRNVLDEKCLREGATFPYIYRGIYLHMVSMFILQDGGIFFGCKVDQHDPIYKGASISLTLGSNHFQDLPLSDLRDGPPKCIAEKKGLFMHKLMAQNLVKDGKFSLKFTVKLPVVEAEVKLVEDQVKRAQKAWQVKEARKAEEARLVKEKEAIRVAVSRAVEEAVQAEKVRQATEARQMEEASKAMEEARQSEEAFFQGVTQDQKRKFQSESLLHKKARNSLPESSSSSSSSLVEQIQLKLDKVSAEAAWAKLWLEKSGENVKRVQEEMEKVKRDKENIPED